MKTKKTTLKQLMESARPGKFKRFAKRVCEMDAPLGDMPIPDMPPDALSVDPSGSIKATTLAMLQSIIDGEGTDAEKVTKLRDAMATLKGEAAADDATDAPAADAPTAESLALRRAQSEIRVREIAESKGVNVSGSVLRGIAMLESEAEQMAAISDLAANGQPRPKSREYHPREEHDNRGPTDPKEFAQRLRRDY